MNEFEEEYKALIMDIIANGSIESNRTGVDCRVLFSKNIKFDLSTGKMPVITGKKIFYYKAYHEAKWIFKGDTNVGYLNRHGITWWNQYVGNDLNVSKSYGYQLARWDGWFDQIEYVEEEISTGSRRAYMSFWNVTDQNDKIPCCYTGMNFVLTECGTKLNAEVQFRSSDVFLGLPYDFIVLSLILKWIAFDTCKQVGVISFSLSNAHIYSNHIDLCHTYLCLPTFDLPTDNGTDKLDDYVSGPLIKVELNN